MGHDAQGLRDTPRITRHARIEKYVTVRYEGGLGSPYVVEATAMKPLFGSVS